MTYFLICNKTNVKVSYIDNKVRVGIMFELYRTLLTKKY